MFGTSRLKSVLEECSSKTFEEQKTVILKTFQEYKQKTYRKDDITLIGFSPYPLRESHE